MDLTAQNTTLLEALEWLTPLQHSPSPRASLSPEAREFLARAFPENTRLTYRRVVLDFRDWSGLAQPFPTSASVVADYLSHRAKADGLAPSTLTTYASALRFAHLLLGYPDPTKNMVVMGILRGIRRTAQEDRDWAPNRAPAMTLEDLCAMVEVGLDEMTLRDARDRAFLLVGFFGAFRQSELSAIRLERLRETPEGLLIRMGRTKTDQLDSRGHHKALLPGPPGLCPLAAVREWLTVSEITEGWLFRGVTKGGKLAAPPKNARYPGRLSHPTANRILTHRARLAGLDNRRYSVHSLRAGFITVSRQLGAHDWQIQRQSGHQDVRTLGIYDRPESAFEGNAVQLLMEALRDRSSE